MGDVHKGFGIGFALLDGDLLLLAVILPGPAVKYNLNARQRRLILTSRFNSQLSTELALVTCRVARSAPTRTADCDSGHDWQRLADEADQLADETNRLGKASHRGFSKGICVGRWSFIFCCQFDFLPEGCCSLLVVVASLELDFFRYPKLVVNDNIEDKGMEEERSQNLQKIVVEISKRSNVRHQIIMATSKIDPSLETPELCIGPSYTLQNKTLQIPNRAIL